MGKTLRYDTFEYAKELSAEELRIVDKAVSILQKKETEMKTVTIEGKEYEVPDKVKWVAMDESELWWGYENRPVPNKFEQGRWDADGELFRTYAEGASVHWTETLQEV